MVGTTVDDLLLPFLRASEEESAGLLEVLMSEHAGPLIKKIIRSKLRISLDNAGPGSPDAEDIYGDVVLRLLVKLRDLRTDSADRSISDFRGYVAVTTYNALNEHLRLKHPRRSSLKNKLRYLLNRRSEFAAWQNTDHETLCGYATWQDQGRARAQSDRLHELHGNPRVFTESLRHKSIERLSPQELLGAIFDWVDHPLEFDELVSAVAELWGVKDQKPQTETEAAEMGASHDQLADPNADVATEVHQRLYLQQLWAEVLRLPLRQRAALLLNLKDAKGGGVINLLPVAGIATVREIAQVLAIPAEEFAGLWKELPLDDATIAQRLSVTRQQVINLRKSARERLARRMKGA